MIVIGIDIGLTGGLGFVGGSAPVVLDMPVKIEGEKKRIDGRALAEAIRAHCPVGHASMVVFEDVRPRPEGNAGGHGNTMHSQGSMMRSRGSIEGVLDVMRLQHHVVQPQTWKRFYGLLKTDKKASREKALVLYPQVAHDLRLVKDHNKAEALLIAHWGLRNLA